MRSEGRLSLVVCSKYFKPVGLAQRLDVQVQTSGVGFPPVSAASASATAQGRPNFLVPSFIIPLPAAVEGAVPAFDPPHTSPVRRSGLVVV